MGDVKFLKFVTRLEDKTINKTINKMLEEAAKMQEVICHKSFKHTGSIGILLTAATFLGVCMEEGG